MSSGIEVQLDAAPGSQHERTVSVTCNTPGDFSFHIKASEPMSLLSNETSVRVRCAAEGGTVPDFTTCYDYHPPTH